MQDSVLKEILDWSVYRPAWQRDALRRIVMNGPLTTADIEDLTDLCKAAHGLSASRTAAVLDATHVGVAAPVEHAIRLLSLTHHRGVNALAAEQTITFGDHLTVVYGQNAAGKSGYARILKRACRSRSTEEILGNVLSGLAPLKPAATIRCHDGIRDLPVPWSLDSPSHPSLAAVSVFDSQSAPVYLRDKTDVAFRPFGLDVFDKLSAACGDVRRRLDTEQGLLSSSATALPTVTDGTQVKRLFDSLTGLTRVDNVRALGTLSSEEKERLAELRKQQRDLQASDPKERARDLALKADRIALIERHVASLAKACDEGALRLLRSTGEALQAAQTALATLRQSTLTPDLIAGTGEDAWRRMWEAAKDFAGTVFPQHSRCPLCQQAIAAHAADLLRHLEEYAASDAQLKVRELDASYRSQLAKLTQTPATRPELDVALVELAAENPDIGERVGSFLRDIAQVQDEVMAASASDRLPILSSVGTSPAAGLVTMIKGLRARSTVLQAVAPALDSKAAEELRELDARETLAGHLGVVEAEIERKKRIAAYRQCVDDTNTQPITKKSTELTKHLVTERLRQQFQDELAGLEFDHLAVEIQAAGGTKGTLFHHLVFSTAPGVSVTRVLSEGESRTLSLAAFLTELSTAATKSGILFDDPVSSLDHIWRQRIARRLVREASGRQVIVFTHDLLFLRFLIAEAERQNVPIHHQYVRRENEAGVCSSDLPWVAMAVKERLGVLKSRWQSADKVYRTEGPSAYEAFARDIYGSLRETWEQAVGEVLLNNVIERYRPSIETKRVSTLQDITEADCQAVEDGMTECSRWIRGHDAPPADATPLPKPADLKQRIEDFENWAKAIRKRRGG